MKIRVAGWESKGLRCPDVAINFVDEPDKRSVILIQMPNGTGKTTTLNLIRAAMTGSAQQWLPDQVRALRRPRAKNTTARFVLKLLVDRTDLTFELNFDFSEGTVRYKSSSPSLGGKVEGWLCPASVKRFLTERFTDLFVFDGELANRLLEKKHTEAERAIDALCQVELLDRVVQVAQADWERALRGQQGAKTRQGLAQWERREDDLRAHEKTVRAAHKKLLTEREEKARRISELEGRLSVRAAQNRKYTAAIAAAREREASASSVLSNRILDAMDCIRKPHVLHGDFAAALEVFRLSLDKAKLPESSSRQFFLELAEDPECVCGRPIGEKERLAIREQADRYLGDDIAGVINAMKSDITQYAVGGFAQDNSQFKKSMKALEAAEEELLSSVTATESVVSESLAEGDQEALLKDQDELTKARLSLETVQDDLEEMERAATDADGEKTVCLKAIQRQLKEIRAKIAEISDTVGLREQLDAVEALAKRAKELSREKIRAALLTESNVRLRQILKSDPIQLARIGQFLELDSQAGASVGQTLAVGYTFLTAVLHRGFHQFPLIVDSPAGPLDHVVRKEVALMIPRLAEQFIAFVISTEREGFVPWLEKGEKTSVQYLTLFRKTDAVADLIAALPKKGVEQTENAVLVSGKDYFNKFAIVEEEV